MADRILATEESAEMIEALQEYLIALTPPPDADGRRVTALVKEVQRRSDIVRAEQLAAHAGMSLRSL